MATAVEQREISQLLRNCVEPVVLSHLFPDRQAMRQTVIKGAYATLSCILLATAGFNAGADAASVESRTECQPPKPGEYLLLIVAETAQSQRLLKQTLPDGTNITVCNYLDNVVARIGGFTSLEDAQDWKRYVNDIAGLPAYVAEPSAGAESATGQPRPSTSRRREGEAVAEESVPTAPPRSSSSSETEEEQQARQPSRNSPAFNPQLLGRGYAVLVDYSNQPEIASELQQLLGKEVGLVSFGQRPYLLALYSSNERNANNTFRLLSDRGFLVMLVDSNKVTLLKPEVKGF